MGRYDDIPGEEIQRRFRKFARIVRTMEEQGVLLERAPTLLHLLGELRQMLFAYEVRSTLDFGGSEQRAETGAGTAERGEARTGPDAQTQRSLKIVRDALRREEELRRELEADLFPGPREDRD